MNSYESLAAVLAWMLRTVLVNLAAALAWMLRTVLVNTVDCKSGARKCATKAAHEGATKAAHEGATKAGNPATHIWEEFAEIPALDGG